MGPDYERVIWLDPGKTTGWATLTSDFSFDSGELDFFDLGNELESYAKYYHSRLFIGYERFVVTPSMVTGDPEYSFEVIGMVKWLCYVHHVTLLDPVVSADRKLGMDGGKLHKLGWHKPTKDGHADDAAAHLLAWLLREKRVPMKMMSELLAE